MNEKPITRYVDTDTGEFLKLSREGLVAAFLYSRNALKGGEIYRLDEENETVRCIAKSQVMHLPECFFSRFAGVSVEVSCERVVLSYGENTVEFKTGDNNCLQNGKKSKASMPMIYENGHYYIAALEVCSMLGISARCFCGGKLFVIAEESILNRLYLDESLANSGCFAVLGEYRARELTHEDFVKAKDKWRKILVGSPELNLTGEKSMVKKLNDIADECEELMASMHREPDAVILWGDKAPTESSDLTAQYSRIWLLAKAYGTAGNRYYKSEEVCEAVLYGLRWMYENMYGEAEIEGRGWRDTHLFNWWDWHVGAIEPFTDTLLVMEDRLTKEEIKTYLRCYDFVCTFMRLGYTRANASSRIKTGSKEALLIEDGNMLYEKFIDFDLQFEEVEGTRGKYTDYCRWEHNIPYNLMYGLGNLHRTVFLATVMAGTPAEFPTPFLYDMFTLVKYMFEAAIYKGQGFSIFRGRGNSGVEIGFGMQVMTRILYMIGLFGEDEDRYLKTMIKRNVREESDKELIKNECSVYYLALLNSIFDDPTIPSDVDYEMTHAWFTADRIAHQKKNYAFLLAMPSSRHPNYESINSANKKGWYTGDGGLYLYTDTDRHSFDGKNFISNVEVAQRIPGTTADDRRRTPWSYRRGWKSSMNFAGCMDLEERYGMGAFDYEPYHYDGHEADGTVDDGYGGGFTFWENDLTARKSYFFFDKECVCLGAMISSTMDSNVLTTVEHRRLVKDNESGTEAVISDGKAILEDAKSGIELDSPSYVHLEGFAGYVFPEKCKVYAGKYKFNAQDGTFDHYFRDSGDKLEDKDKTFFELRIEHGKNPKDEKYSYVILPAATAEETAKYAQSPEVKILRNDERVQSVTKESVGVTSTVFYVPETASGITATVPSIVMTKRTESTLKISVCDPTQLEKEGRFTVEGKLKCTYHDRELEIEVDEKLGTTTVIASFDNMAGKNLVAEFEL